MGGNTFEGLSRINQKDYEAIINLIEGEVNAGSPYTVRSKTEHGDIDFIYSDNLEHIESQLREDCHLDIRSAVRNGPTTSYKIAYNDKFYQLDFTKVSADVLSFNFYYFSYNDLGNLIGRIAHRQGLKFGNDGLWYVHRKGDNQLSEILLTRNFWIAIKYLGFDAEKYREGFETFEEMFEWVVKSKYFEPSAFPLEHRNHKARTRDRKRETYNKFLNYISFDGVYVPSNKEAWLERHLQDFPHLKKEIEKLDQQYELDKYYKTRVNGSIVSEKTGLEGKQLGVLMKIVKDVLPKETIRQLTDETVDAGIRFAYLKYIDDQNSTWS